MGGLNLTIIKNLKIKLPSLKKQNEFLSINNKINRIKEKMRQSRNEMDNYFHSILQRAFKGEL